MDRSQELAAAGQGYEAATAAGQGYEAATAAGQGYEAATAAGQGYEAATAAGQGYEAATAAGQGYEAATAAGQGYEAATAALRQAPLRAAAAREATVDWQAEMFQIFEHMRNRILNFLPFKLYELLRQKISMRGVSIPSLIEANTCTGRFHPGMIYKVCGLCDNAFLERDRIRWLRCLHYLHQRCADLWLRDHNTCIICGHVVYVGSE